VTPVVNVDYYIEMDLLFMTGITANLCKQQGSFYEPPQTEIGLICFDVYHAYIRTFLECMYVA
jgi:hypothetical protein